MNSAIKFCDGFSAIVDEFDGFILDLWGVIHNGVEPLPGSIECMKELRRSGKPITLLSNAPRRVHSTVAKLRELGIDDELYDHILTSGEEAWLSLKNRTDIWYSRLGRTAYHIGKGGADKDADMREDLANTEFTDDVKSADFVLLTGTTDPAHQIDDYRNDLEAAASRSLPLICANPDLVVIRGTNREICAGTLAEYYKSLGGEVRYHGKPHESVYRTCCEMMGLPFSPKVVGVGDSLRTDVHGAKNAGLTSVFIAGGIYAEPMGIKAGDQPSPEAFHEVAKAYEHLPDYVMPLFAL